jgi:hypothetical protein
MRSKTVNLADFAKELREFNEGSLEEQRLATVRGIAASIPDLVKASPVDTGLYGQSWNFSSTEESAILGNTAPHAPIIEYGARPFTPPIGPLLAWAKRVLQDPSQPPDYSDKVWALARGVQGKIAKSGMQPKKVMENMIPAIIENIRQEFERLGKS